VSTVSRACAFWLIALILTPFSAPFSVCDAATFFHVAPAPASSPLRPARPSASLRDDSSDHGLPAVRVFKSVKAAGTRARVRLPFLIEATSTADRSAVFLAIPNAPLILPLRI